MPDEDFKRGEAKAHLEHITKEVSDIKTEMKEHNASDKAEFSKINDKIDEVAEATYEAADQAGAAANRVKNQEEVIDERHEENKKQLARIEKKVDIAIEQNADTSKKVAKIYTVAGIVGAIGGLLAPRVIDLILNLS